MLCGNLHLFKVFVIGDFHVIFKICGHSNPNPGITISCSEIHILKQEMHADKENMQNENQAFYFLAYPKLITDCSQNA